VTVGEKDVVGAHFVQDPAVRIRDLDPAMVERAPVKQAFAQHFPVGADGFRVCGSQIGQLLALQIPADIAIVVPDVKEISGHGLKPLRP
jgi:hypothetical protein